MITETNEANLRLNLSEHLSNVQDRRDVVVIKQDGRPVAALVDVRLFQRIRRMEGRFNSLCERIEVGFSSIPEDIGTREIEAAINYDRSVSRDAGTNR